MNTPKFKIGDKVIADGEIATITRLVHSADSDFIKTVGYAVEWLSAEWGTFAEDELLEVVVVGGKMKYTLKFVEECKTEYLWYKDELKVLLKKHNMQDLYVSKIEPVNRYSWYPNEVFAALEKL